MKESIKPERDRIKESLDMAKLNEASEPLMLNQTDFNNNENNGKQSGGGGGGDGINNLNSSNSLNQSVKGATTNQKYPIDPV